MPKGDYLLVLLFKNLRAKLIQENKFYAPSFLSGYVVTFR
jgi:hypothetical protein